VADRGNELRVALLNGLLSGDVRQHGHRAVIRAPIGWRLRLELVRERPAVDAIPVWLAFLVGQRHFGGPLRRGTAAARLAQHAHELLAALELLERRMLLGCQLDIEQFLGARVGQDDLAELIDGQHRVGQTGENLAQLVAFDSDSPHANVGRRTGHFKLFHVLAKFGQPLAHAMA
jgi:hypothetical protein